MWKFCLSCVLLLSACASDVDTTDNRVSIQYLKTLYRNSPLELTADYVISGRVRVVSSDLFGNLRYTLVIQDETGAIVIYIKEQRFCEKYHLGDQVRLNCRKMVMSDYGGTIQLSTTDGTEPLITYEGSPTNEVVALELTPDKFSRRWVSCYVKIKNVQFIKEDLGRTWYDTTTFVRRRVEFLDSGDTVNIISRSDALFAHKFVPSSSGDIYGILDYFGSSYSLQVIDNYFHSMSYERFEKK